MESDSEDSYESEYTPSPKKSANAVPDQWTRVKNVAEMIDKRVTIFDIEKDLNADKVLKAVRAGSAREHGAVLFDPDEWKGKSEELKIQQHALPESKLREYAMLATKLRRQLQTKADEAAAEEEKEEEKVVE